MFRASLGIAIVALLACGGSDASTGPAPANISGTWNSSLLHLNLAQTASNLSGSGSFTDPANGGCNFSVSGTYNAGSVALGMGSTIVCNGSFSGTASADRISGSLSFTYAADASQPRRTTTADITLIKQ